MWCSCWFKLRFSQFMCIASLSLSWNLVRAESRISKQSAEQDKRQRSELCKCLKICEDLSEERCLRTRVEKWRPVSPIFSFLHFAVTQYAINLCHPIIIIHVSPSGYTVPTAPPNTLQPTMMLDTSKHVVAQIKNVVIFLKIMICFLLSRH